MVNPYEERIPLTKEGFLIRFPDFSHPETAFSIVFQEYCTQIRNEYGLPNKQLSEQDFEGIKEDLSKLRSNLRGSLENLSNRVQRNFESVLPGLLLMQDLYEEQHQYVFMSLKESEKYCNRILAPKRRIETIVRSVNNLSENQEQRN